MNTNTKEQKIIQLFMAVLFLAIVLVYLLLFQVKGKNLRALPNNDSWSAVQISVMSWDQEQTLTAVDVLAETPKTATNTWGNIIVLSGTNVFYGTIESIEKLGIKYQYALVDDKNIYYINLGNPVYDFASIARKLWGNLYELKTEQELAQNKLFGTKVVYINLPEYKEKKVLMLLYIKDQVRLIQMDYSLYHKTKKYLKSLFTQ